MPNLTQNYGFEKPGVDDPDFEDLWGGILNDNLDLIDAAIASQSLRRVAMYHWTRSLNAGRWENYSITASNEAGNLRFTNQSGTGDARLDISVPPNRTIIIRAQPVASSGMSQLSPEMHLGNAANSYGGYGFDYPVGEDIVLETTDGQLTIYVVTREGGAGDWVEFSDLTVDLIEDGTRVTASTTPPASPSEGDVWIDLS